MSSCHLVSENIAQHLLSIFDVLVHRHLFFFFFPAPAGGLLRKKNTSITDAIGKEMSTHLGNQHQLTRRAPDGARRLASPPLANHPAPNPTLPLTRRSRRRRQPDRPGGSGASSGIGQTQPLRSVSRRASSATAQPDTRRTVQHASTTDGSTASSGGGRLKAEG